MIDRDWRSSSEVEALERDHGVFVLPVHEIENLFLHRGTLEALARQNGVEGFVHDEALKRASDPRAGGWILQSALFDPRLKGSPALRTEARAHARSLGWSEISEDVASTMSGIASESGYPEELEEQLDRLLVVRANIYGRKRDEDDFWKCCEGKQVSNALPGGLGFANFTALERAATSYWAADESRLPEEVATLRRKLLDI